MHAADARNRDIDDFLSIVTGQLMKILVLTLGSRGDIQPFVALGQGLQAAGHEVALCTSEHFEPFIREHGINYFYMNNDMIDFIDSDEGRSVMESTRGVLSLLKTAWKMKKKIPWIDRRMIHDTWAAARTMRPDLIVYHPKCYASQAFAGELGARAVLALLQPLFAMTGDFPACVFPAWPLGRAYNRLTYRIAHALAWVASHRRLREWASAEGVPPTKTVPGPLVTPDGSQAPILHGFSQHIAGPADDWPESALMSGSWFLDAEKNFRPDAELQKFLAAGEPPVYIGFGSMSGRTPERLADIVLQAVAQSGVRAILAKGWGGLRTDRLPEGVHPITEAPHSWLFPRVRAVVHHGGSGSTAAGLRAGRPTLICPFILDQFFWGRQVHRLGVGPKPVPQRKLTPERLAAAIRQMVTDTAMQEKAATLGRKLRAEDGVANGVRFLERIAAGSGTPPR